uniref:Putative glycosyltransferase n=1 Tax=viral metagenome TaxID=1070528 RepID=A0A6M3KT66_9ZZZZ
MENTGKPRLLLISDSAMLHTGMGVAAREIATRLYRMDKYEIRTFGWFAHTAEQRGVKWNLPWRQYTTSDYSRPYGHPQGYPEKPNWDTCPIVKIIEDYKPDVVIVIGDQWMADFILDMPNRRKIRILWEFPIDGLPIPKSWIKSFKKADIPIVMSEFAVNEIKKVDEYFKVELNPRGLDTRIFLPQTLDRPKDFLRKTFMPSSIGRFVVGVFNRFQDRKQIGRAIEAFSKFTKKYKHDDCDLYLHMDMSDSASIQQGKTLLGEDGLLKRYGLDGKILCNKNITVEQGISAPELAATYNCCDVCLNTTQGEGWGNSIAESLACGIPNIVTNYTTPTEFAKSGGIKLIDVITTITGMYNVERALADTDHAADLLEELYRSPVTRKEMGKKGAEWAKQFNWENNIQNWVSYIERCLKGNEYTPISKTKERELDLEPNINIQGAVFENTGFSIVTKNLAKALDDIGVNVSLEPRVPHLAKFFKVEEQITKLINKDKNTVFEFINHMGDEQLRRLPESKAKYKIAYFPWELTNIKNEWVDGLNKYADAVWCNSQFTTDIYKNAGIHEDKLFVLPNGKCLPKVERNRDVEDKKYKFLCVGNLGDKRKNVETLIQSYLSEFSGEDDVELILKSQPGHIDSDPTELVEFLSRTKPNPPKVTVIHADYTDKALAQLMADCDCFITASHAEGFCHPILEATSIGMPVIAPMYGGYLEFAQNGKFFGVAVDISEATKSPVYYYNSKWADVKFKELMRVMREVFVNKVLPDGVNYVPDHTWENTATKMKNELKNVAKRASQKKVKIYYHNFAYNLWNNDNKLNFVRYAPSDIEFVDDFESADLQIVDITRLSDKHNIKCKNYIVNFHCKGEFSEENIMYYSDIFENAVMVYSHLDLKGEMTGSDKWTEKEFDKKINFVCGPWGVDEDLFYTNGTPQKAYTMLTTGAVAPTEAIAECLYACQSVKGKLLHVGPNMFPNAEGYLNTRNLTIREMCGSYSLSYYTNSMRRIEGFEKTFSEGVLSSSRPICFDTPLYRHWYKDIPEYVKEGTPEEIIKDLIDIFKKPYRPITDKEKQFVVDNFSWIKVSKNFWKNFKKIWRSKDDKSNGLG